MPTYDYRCKNCKGEFEVTHRISENRPRCPDCGSPVERVFLHAPAVHGYMARGREVAARTLEPPSKARPHGANCPCCRTGSIVTDK